MTGLGAIRPRHCGAQITRVEIGNLALIGARRTYGALLDDTDELRGGCLLDLIAGAPTGVTDWDFGRFEPVAVGIREEIIARCNAGVYTALDRSDSGIDGCARTGNRCRTADTRNHQQRVRKCGLARFDLQWVAKTAWGLGGRAAAASYFLRH